jgi:ribosomal protein S18 acetylase RimI-like enzyme
MLVLRPATNGDARAIAELMDIAGERIPSIMWSAAALPGQTALEVGAMRAARRHVSFSFENATIAESEGEVLGMLLGYPIDGTDPGDLSAVPPMIRPLVRLECLAPGTWYLNAVATVPHYRGKGLGRLMLNKADALALEAGRAVTSLIVAGSNEHAVRLYEGYGYRVAQREPVVPHPDLHTRGDWLLMTRLVRRGM